MTRVAFVDVGDVLLRTRPMAHYRRIADLTGLHWRAVQLRLEAADLIADFEAGRYDGPAFAAEVAQTIGFEPLDVTALRDAWNAVLGEVDPVVAAACAPWAPSRRLVLASNTNPFHWPVVRDRLAAAGLRALAVLSFEVGAVKPSQSYMRRLVAMRDSLNAEQAVLVDDRREHPGGR